MKSVDIVNVLLALINLPLDPMPVEVFEEMVDVFGSCGISVPLVDVECEEGFVCVCLGLVDDCLEVAVEVLDQVVIQILAK